MATVAATNVSSSGSTLNAAVGNSMPGVTLTNTFEWAPFAAGLGVTPTVSTFAGTADTPGSTDGAVPLFGRPGGLALDESGGIYLADVECVKLHSVVS